MSRAGLRGAKVTPTGGPGTAGGTAGGDEPRRGPPARAGREDREGRTDHRRRDAARPEDDGAGKEDGQGLERVAARRRAEDDRDLRELSDAARGEDLPGRRSVAR